jgi:hypothetical protein
MYIVIFDGSHHIEINTDRPEVDVRIFVEPQDAIEMSQDTAYQNERIAQAYAKLEDAKKELAKLVAKAMAIPVKFEPVIQSHKLL